jgi:hypothetical protein
LTQEFLLTHRCSRTANAGVSGPYFSAYVGNGVAAARVTATRLNTVAQGRRASGAPWVTPAVHHFLTLKALHIETFTHVRQISSPRRRIDAFTPIIA